MDNTGEVLTPAVTVPIEQTADIAGEAIGAVLETEVITGGIGESLTDLDLSSIGEDIFSSGTQGEESFVTEESATDELDNVREELSEISEQDRLEKSESEIDSSEQLAILDATIAMLTVQRDALKEQLGGGVWAFMGELMKEFFSDTFPEANIESMTGEEIAKKSWKENARTQLRNIEKELSDLKEYRKQFVANN